MVVVSLKSPRTTLTTTRTTLAVSPGDDTAANGPIIQTIREQAHQYTG